MLIVADLVALALFGALLWCAVTVARFRELPTRRRFLPLALFLTVLAASILRGAGIPQIAAAIAFPLNLAALILAITEIRTHRHRQHQA
ncbi:hypothetical protein ABZ702_22115 [Streptomyces cyaneofuscatus]|uniref:hypothetical protein n=1 Tax=Streptomyces cyaneofuscatus TaxID=66883 RepID=UPI0033CB1C23